MKKIYLVFSLLMLLFASCKKDGKSPSKPDPQQPDTTGKTYSVSFNVGIDADSRLGTGLKKNSAKIDIQATEDIKSVASYLEYYVYNADGKIVSTIIQKAQTPNFGKISDTFSAGEYTMIVWASNTQPTQVSGDVVYPQGRDVFYKKVKFTVSSTSANTQQILLNRLVGQLQVKVLDTIPANAKRLTVSVLYDYGFSVQNGIVDGNPYKLDYNYDLKPEDIGKPNYIATTNVTNTRTSGFSVQIVCTTADGTKLSNMTVNKVTCQPNKRTILSGKIFANPTGSFEPVFNENWDPAGSTIEF